MGRIQRPRVLAAAITSSPATTSASLLASETSLSASSAATVGLSEAKPLMATTTRSAFSCVAALMMAPSPTSMPLGAALRPLGRLATGHVGVAMSSLDLGHADDVGACGHRDQLEALGELLDDLDDLLADGAGGPEHRDAVVLH